MPRCSTLGALGGDAAQVSFKGKEIAGRGTCASMLTPSIAVYNVFVSQPDNWAFETQDLLTGKATRPNVPACNQLAACGGKWLAWRAGYGVYSLDGLVSAAAGLAAVGTDGRGAAGTDGTMAIVQDRQNGTGLRLLPPQGAAVILPDRAIGTLAIESRDVVTWCEGGQVRALGTRDPAVQADPIFAARSVWLGTQRLLLVTTNTSLILRKWDEAVGKVLASNSDGFAADVVAVDLETAFVTWSTTSGERPEDIRWQSVSVKELTTPIVPPQPPPVIITPANRSLWFGPFQYGGTPPVGNCSLPVDDQMVVRANNGGPVVKYLASEGTGLQQDLVNLEKDIADWRSAGNMLRSLCYWTYGAQQIRLPKGAELVLVEAYQKSAESLDALKTRLIQSILQCQTPWLAGQCYTSNLTNNNSDLRSLVELYSELLKEFPRITGFLFFSAGTGRRTGWEDHPEVWSLYRELYASVTGVGPYYVVMPPKPEPPKPEPPKPVGPFPIAPPYGGHNMADAALRMGEPFLAIDTRRKNGDGTYPVTISMNNDRNSDACKFQESVYDDGRLRYVHSPTGFQLECDATRFSGSLATMFYFKQADGGYGAFNGYTTFDGAVHQIQMQWDRDGEKYVGPCLTVVAL